MEVRYKAFSVTLVNDISQWGVLQSELQLHPFVKLNMFALIVFPNSFPIRKRRKANDQGTG